MHRALRLLLVIFVFAAGMPSVGPVRPESAIAGDVSVKGYFRKNGQVVVIVLIKLIKRHLMRFRRFFGR